MSEEFTTYEMVNQFNHKRIIEIATYTMVSPETIKEIEEGLQLVIDTCNENQSDLLYELFSIDDESTHIVGLMVEDTCPYEDETVKKYFITQMVTSIARMEAEISCK